MKKLIRWQIGRTYTSLIFEPNLRIYHRLLPVIHVAHVLSFLVVFCFVLFVFVLFLVCPMLPGSINCQFLIIPSDFSNVYLPTFDSVPILSMKHPIEYSLCFWSSPVADPAFGSCYMRMIGRLHKYRILMFFVRLPSK